MMVDADLERLARRAAALDRVDALIAAPQS